MSEKRGVSNVTLIASHPVFWEGTKVRELSFGADIKDACHERVR